MSAAVRRLRAATRPLSLVYAIAVAARDAAYARGLVRAQGVGVPVVSVGNLTTGGTGKTPLVRAVVRRLEALGRRPGVLLRGYGASGATEPVPAWREAPPPGALARYGDEALEHVRALGENAIVVAAADRVRGAEAARAAGADVLVLDDGFQHRRIRRDLDLVCLDATRPFGRGGLLPAGDLREPVGALARADLVMWTRARPGQPLPALPVDRPVVSWQHAPEGCRRAGSDAPMTPRRAVVAAHVAHPDAVAATAREAGIHVVALRGGRDHAPFEEPLVESLELLRLQEDADAIVVTAKDEPRLLDSSAGRRLATAGHIAVLGIAVTPLGSTEALDAAIARVVRRRETSGARPPRGETGASRSS